MRHGNNKRELERHQFEQFCRLKSELDLTLISQPEPPAPDIIADFQGRRVGIEITTFCSQEKLKKREAEEDAIIEIAQTRYAAGGFPAVGVTVGWNSHLPSTRANRSKLADALAAAIEQNIPQVGSWSEITWDSLQEPLLSAVSYITIRRITNDLWHSARAGWFPAVHSPEIQEKINGKDKRTDGYKFHCDEVWLLIMATGSPASWCELHPASQQAVYFSRFKRVFFVSDAPAAVAELRQKVPSI
jgi:hypothetical protein